MWRLLSAETGLLCRNAQVGLTSVLEFFREALTNASELVVGSNTIQRVLSQHLGTILAPQAPLLGYN
jgi:hypothetical protein